MTTQSDTKTVTLHEQAADTIAAMQGRVEQIGNLFGKDSPEHAAAARSLADMLSKIMIRGFGNADVSRDGELSLFIREEGFVYGVIFFRDRGAALRHLIRNGHKPEDMDDAVLANYTAQYDNVAGTWSAHS